ncbi:MAG TPA: PHP domain-containing protein, partial [Balneolaceae bacterium]|nr:PHP domain-containing protein [Balneolaceae bacterium]
VISITDHDTIKGYQKAKEAAAGADIELIPGVEITARFNQRECHLLAYCFDPEHESIIRLLKNHYHARLKRAKWIIEQLSKKGLDLSIDEVRAEAGAGNVGRPHIAAVLVGKGYVASYKEAFIRYLSDAQLGTIDSEYHTHHEVIEAVKEAGGAVVIAHPGRLYSKDELNLLVEAGVDGIEVIHPSHNYETQKRVEDFAAEHNLLMTGGSDFHGGHEEYQKFFGIVTIHSRQVQRLIRLTNQRKKLTV